MSKESSGLFSGTIGSRSSSNNKRVGNSGKTQSQIKQAVRMVIPSLPKNPNTLLKEGWIETTPPLMKKNTDSQTFKDPKSGFDIRFDKGEPGANGFKGEDHYHVNNPNSKSNKDKYLDKDGNPCAKGSKASHIIP